MTIWPGDNVRAAERIAKLIGRFAERFDPPDRAAFYESVAGKINRMHLDAVEFIHGDDMPVRKKLPTRAARKDAGRRSA